MQSSQLFDIGPSGQAVTAPEHRDAISSITVRVKEALGTVTKRNVWPYRDGKVEYVSLDLEGEKGAIAITLAIVGSTDLSDAFKIGRVSTPMVCVTDAVDAFYLVHAILSATSHAPTNFTAV